MGLHHSATYRLLLSTLLVLLLAAPGLLQDVHRMLDHWHEAPACVTAGAEAHLHDVPSERDLCFLCNLPSLSPFLELTEPTLAYGPVLPATLANQIECSRQHRLAGAIRGRAPPSPTC